jgi:hypothetical protein
MTTNSPAIKLDLQVLKTDFEKAPHSQTWASSV